MKRNTVEPPHPRTVRPNARRKNFLVEEDVDKKMELAAKRLTGGNQTELLHRMMRFEIEPEALKQALA